VDKFGIAVMCWKRPEILTQNLAALAINDLTGVDVHVWQEGLRAPSGEARTDPSEQQANLAVFQAAALPSKVFHQHEYSQGYAGQQYLVMPWMAEHYPIWVLMDSDVIWGRHAVAILRKLFEQYATDPRVGSINPGMRLRCPLDQLETNWDSVTLDAGLTRSLCTEGFWTPKWEKLWPWYEEYYRIAAPWPYHHIGEPAAREAVATWATRVGSRLTEPSSDTAIVRAIELSGMLRMCPVVNRAQNIGDYGFNCRPGVLESLGLAHQPIYESEGELGIQGFRIVEATV
jgi:hypothetical protein